jgi:UDP-glucose 4-epimerase
MTRGQSILITGALGHIGSQFIHSLKPGDFKKVVLVDSLLTQRYCSLFNLPQGVPFHFVEEDILNESFKALCAGMDIVIHLAAITDATNSFKSADEIERINYEGTAKVAFACKAFGCKMIFFSTTSVYGVKTEVVDEDCPEEGLIPQSPYAASKLKAERLLAQMGKTDGLKFIICRLGTICGTSIGMRFHTAINKFCWQACLGRPITVWRTALHQRRPYLSLDDAVSMLKFIIENDLFDQQVYNAVTDNLTVSSIIRIIEKYIKNINVQYVDAEIMNQLSFDVLNSRLKSKGFNFTGSIEENIKQTVGLIKNAGRHSVE